MRQWAIVVGLNDYQFFQPLSCAQRDAQAVHQFLVNEAGFPAEQCFLLTDASPPLWGKPTKPTRSNLLGWFELLAQNCLKPGDSLWFFFSGYGVCSQGRDYLAPLDGDPFAVETTCILMSSIFSRLQASIAPGMMLLLFDMNRSQGMFSNEPVGNQTAQLAKQFAVPTILSCRPDQFSRDISSVGHGLFTVGLLEGFRYYQGATPATLMQFLGDRLPELSQYYYLPGQQPVCMCPSEKLHQMLLQAHYTTQTSKEIETNGNGRQATPALERGDTVGQAPMAVKATDKKVTTTLTPNPNHLPLISVSRAGIVNQEHPGNGTHQDFSTHQDAFSRNGTLRESAPPYNHPENPMTSRQREPAALNVSAPSVDFASSPQINSSQAERPNMVRDTNSYRTTEIAESTVPTNGTPTMNSGSVSKVSSAEVPSTKEHTDENFPRRVFWLCGLISLGLIIGVIWRNWSAIWADPQPAVANSPSAVAPVSPGVEQSPEQIRPTSTNVGAAGDPSSPVPSPEMRTSDQALNVNPVFPSTPTAEQANGQTTLEKARRMIWSDQATPYRDAIAEAKRIPPTDPAYPAAQQEIAVWGQTILNIAQQRANQKQWDIAIMAADLVPLETQELRVQAQTSLAEWCPMIKSQPVQFFPMQQAKNICSQQPI